MSRNDVDTSRFGIVIGRLKYEIANVGGTGYTTPKRRTTMPKNRATLKDIARHANVSIRTVSRVVNGEGEISEDTRKRVQRIIEELGYRPNAVARTLVMGKSHLIATIIPQITDAFFPEFINGVQEACKAGGYSVLLGNTDEDPSQERVLIETMADKQVDGLILCGTRLGEEELSAIAERHHVVVITSQHPRNASTLHIPGNDGLYRTTGYLVEIGHRAIGHLGFRREGNCERLNGYRAALSANDIAFDPRLVVQTERLTVEEGRRAMAEMLEHDVTAVACYNDVVAVGAMLECLDRGVRVPDEVSITGFDDIPLATMIRPTLTTIHVPRHQLGRTAASMLFDIVDDRPISNVEYDGQAELLVRDSTAPPAAVRR